MFRLGTFNLYQYCAPGHYWYARAYGNAHSTEKWEAKNAWILEQLEKMNADVVGFQEVFSPDTLRVLTAKAGYPHFHVVDAPKADPDQENVYSSSIVAIASRHPFIEVGPAPIAAEVINNLPVSENFTFSRMPVRAEIDIPGFGSLITYVVHLKSKRPVVEDIEFAAGVPIQKKVRKSLRATSRGHAASLLQRGAEAALLYHAVTEDISKADMTPVVILGDLNDKVQSIPLEAMSMRGRVYEIDGVEWHNLDGEAKRQIFNHRLWDAYDLAPNQDGNKRPATHFHHGQPGVLDYIFVSNSFNTKAPGNTARVTSFKVYNKHLGAHGSDKSLTRSDHGQVVVTIEPVIKITGSGTSSDDQENLSQLTIISNSNGTIRTREDFVSAAGGVFESPKSYSRWGGREKFRNFWQFYFDENFGWVRSVYGNIPISELHQKQRHSIEHIIPYSFLQEFMRENNRPKAIRRGATVNPFNLMAAERRLNVTRSSFAFEMDMETLLSHGKPGDNKTGLSDDEKWIIPTRSRGDIARAILYMVLIYKIDQQYNKHIDWLVHWAKIDSPGPWELAYNDWVAKHRGIRNPLITSPERIQAILNSDGLLSNVFEAG